MFRTLFRQTLSSSLHNNHLFGAAATALPCSSLLLLQFPNSLNAVQCANVHHHLERGDLSRFLGIKRSSSRKANRHWTQRFRRLRGRKWMQVYLPDPEVIRDPTLHPAEMRRQFLLQGIRPIDLQPGRTWKDERPIAITTSEEIMNPYLSPDVRKQEPVWDRLKSTPKQLMGKYYGRQSNMRKALKEVGAEWKPNEFVVKAREMYIAANEALQKRDVRLLSKYVTNFAYETMIRSLGNTTIRWKWLEDLSPAKIVNQIVSTDQNTSHKFAQVTVRFHSRQSLAIYDKFGRLMAGSENVPIEVQDYVVFERMISPTQSTPDWRVHAKLIFDNQRSSQLTNYRTGRYEDNDTVENRRKEKRDRSLDRMQRPDSSN